MILSYKTRDELESEIRELKARKCETCQHFDHQKGSQPDGLKWETVECLEGIWIQPMDIDTSKISCTIWELKK